MIEKCLSTSFADTVIFFIIIYYIVLIMYIYILSGDDWNIVVSGVKHHAPNLT